ncbi:Uncharacterized conserved protein [Ceraceosorus bombacis]|uniref:Uncharacterized conserved protein n=1 Tax=Ceraceosorus bombacis TaxID=401625 RepID=A0A0P1BMU2_9BASI|nr:Uncharacterized conserved protein [Ceraceosorus bombacis]
MPQQAETAYTHWLAKAEPDARMENGVDVSFGLDKFKACKDQTTSWEGVRAPEARNHLRDRMKLNHKVLFYHSNCKLPGVAAIARVVKEGYPDHTAFDPPVTDEAYEAILLLGSRGGWSEWPGKWKAAAAAASSRGSLSAKNEETCVQNVEPQKAKQKAGNGGNSKRKVTNDMHATAAKRGRAAAPRAESRTEGARRSTRQQSKR